MSTIKLGMCFSTENYIQQVFSLTLSHNRWTEVKVLQCYKTQMRGINPLINSFCVSEIILWLKLTASHHPFNHLAEIGKGFGVCEIRPHCAGGPETITELWFSEVENGSVILFYSRAVLHFSNRCLIANSLWIRWAWASWGHLKKPWHILTLLAWRNNSFHL